MSTLPDPPAEPTLYATLLKRYFRRGKISAYRDQFMQADGKMVPGERFSDIQRLMDYIDARWYDSDTGEELLDLTLAKELEAKYRKDR